MNIFGLEIPFWALIIIFIIFAIVAWKVIKFALKILIIVIIFFALLIGLDLLNIYQLIQNWMNQIFAVLLFYINYLGY